MILPISPEDLRSLVDAGLREGREPGGRVHLFDVREPEAYRAGHVPRARQVPDVSVVRWIPQQALTHETVVLVDDDGAPHGPAREVAAELVHKWFRRVRYLAGGMAAWRAAGLPVEDGGAAGTGAASTDGMLPPFQVSGTVPWKSTGPDTAGRP